MKVILLKDVRGLGQLHNIKEVSDGYATNFLFPQGLAEAATAQKIETLIAKKEAHESQLRTQEAALDIIIAAAEAKTISLTVRATEKGGLFKALTKKDIVQALQKEYSLVVPEGVVHSDPIKTIGEHAIILEGKHTKAHVTLVVKAL